MAGSDSHYKTRNAYREHFLFFFRMARGKSLFPDLWTSRRPYGSNRQKPCPKSSATSIGLRSRTLATIAEGISHSHPALTVAGPTRIEHHCGTCGDRDATDFFCSALPAHIARPTPHRPSRFSRPAFFYHSFFWALLQANSCVLQLRGLCFPGSALKTLGSLP
jgi:hypothetical protein